MTKRTYIQKIKEDVGKEVTLFAWVQTIRDQGKIKFLILRDVTGTAQVVVSKDSDIFDAIDDVSLESVVKLTGLVKEEKQAPGGVEVSARKIEVLSHAEPELPIPVVVEKGGEETEMTKRFDYRWIDLRKPDRLKIFRVWTALEKGFRGYFEREHYLQVYPPYFMNTPSESGAEVFEVQYFERPAYLAQSPQFYKQAAMASGFEKVFMIGPVFRAEPSFTTRHMTEFTGWDFEISYIESHHDVMAELEKAIISGFNKVHEELSLDIEVPSSPFPKMTIAQAKEVLKSAGVDSVKDFDVSPEEERKLCEIVAQESGSDFVYLIDYPIEARPFYHMRHEDNPTITKSFDLLYKGIEIVTGAQREHRPDVLEKQAKEKEMPLDELRTYIDFFRYGCPPHGGAGIGPGRIIMKMLDLPSVKEATFLPRDVKRLTP
jgi:nondiscriminating aspartyl-tRNA synthetase